jgi:hypothetical protein
LAGFDQASGPTVEKRTAETLGRLTRIVDQGRSEGKAENVSPLAAEATVGGVLAIVQVRLMALGRVGTSRSRTYPSGAQAVRSRAQHASDRGRRDAPSILALTNELMSMIVLPYLGPAGARRELDRPAPASASARRDGAQLSDPFKDAGMRLTYRTVRVLMTIAEHPQG